MLHFLWFGNFTIYFLQKAPYFVFLLGVIGAVDGSHIPIKAPAENSASYINRKNFHSILLQGICDHEYKFIDCYAGEAGSIHDACMFRRSYVGQNLNNLEFNGGHLLADSAYPLGNRILVPYRDNGRLTDIQTNFNRKHSKCRAVIEQAFALLKGRFRRLKLLETVKLELISLFVVAACILHNVCQNQEEPDGLVMENELEEEQLMNVEAENDRHFDNQLAVAKRDNIANLIYRPL